MNNRLGRIRISEEMVRPEYISRLSPLFQEFFPVRIEDNRFLDRTMIYIGYCEKFTEVTEGSPIPLYDVLIKEDKVDRIDKVNG